MLSLPKLCFKKTNKQGYIFVSNNNFERVTNIFGEITHWQYKSMRLQRNFFCGHVGLLWTPVIKLGGIWVLLLGISLFFGVMKQVSGFLIRLLQNTFVPSQLWTLYTGQFCFRSHCPALRRAVFQQVLSLCWINSLIKDGHHHPYIEASAELWPEKYG